MGCEYFRYRDEREVEKVLVINCIKLILEHQAQQMREFDGHNTAGFQEEAYAFDERVHIRHLGQNIVADDQVCLFVLRAHAFGHGLIKELRERWDLPVFRGPGNVCRRFNAQYGDAFVNKMLQEVAVIAR